MSTADFGALSRAEHLLAVHRPQEALRVLAATLSENPNDEIALCLAARAQLDLDEPARAYQLAARAVAVQPEAEYPLRLLACALSELGRADEAIEAAQAAVAKAPDHWQTHSTLAQVSCSTEFLDISWDAAQRAVELGPLEAETHAVMGCVAIERTDKAAADAALREALRLDPNHVGARNDLGRLQMLRRDHVGAALHFAAVAAADPRSTVGQVSIDTALTVAVGRIVFWVSIAVFVVGRFALKEDGETAVAWGYVFLAALILVLLFHAVIVGRAVRGGLGPYLRSLPRRDQLMTAAIAVLLLGVLTLMVMSIVPPESRLVPVIVGVALLWGSRGLLEIRSRRLRRA